MNTNKLLAAVTLAAVTTLSAGVSLAADAPKATTAGGITKEQIVERALKEHPGKVEKAYQDTKKGKEVWEVKIKGDDGKEHELYYDLKTGEAVK